MPHLLLSLLGRLAHYLAGAKATTGSTMAYAFENRLIFPPLPSRGRIPYDHGYPPDDLLTRILENSRAVEGIDRIYVSSAKYCKQKDGAEHEFLIFEVKDKTSSRRNTILIDRVPSLPNNNRNRPPRDMNDLTAGERQAVQGDSDTTNNSAPRARGSVMSSMTSNSSVVSKTHPALDLCYVSATQSYEEMTKRLGRRPHECLSEMTFNDDSFTLERLLILADTLSLYRQRYDLFKTQCYWYAYMLWVLVQRISGATTSPFARNQAAPGTHRFAPWLVKHSEDQSAERDEEFKSLVEEYEKNWEKFRTEELPKWQRDGVTTNDSHTNSAPIAEGPPSKTYEDMQT